MWFIDFFENFYKYFGSLEYQNGIFVEISGIMIELALLTILIPVFLWLLHFKKTRTFKYISSFYSLQLIRKITELLLDLGGVTDVKGELRTMLEKGELNTIESHMIYGNLESLITLLKKKRNDPSYMEGHHNLTPNQIKKIKIQLNNILNYFDKYIFLFTSFGLMKTSEILFSNRMFFYVMNDYLEDINYEFLKNGFLDRDFIGVSNQILESLFLWFFTEKKYIDGILFQRRFYNVSIFLLTLPFMLLYRCFNFLISRLFKKPFLYAGFFPIMFRKSIESSFLSEQEIAEKLQVGIKKMRKYKFGYTYLSRDQEIEYLFQMRDFVDKDVWTSILSDSLEQYIKIAQPNAVTSQEIHAEVLFWTLTLGVDKNKFELFKLEEK